VFILAGHFEHSLFLSSLGHIQHQPFIVHHQKGGQHVEHVGGFEAGDFVGVSLDETNAKLLAYVFGEGFYLFAAFLGRGEEFHKILLLDPDRLIELGNVSRPDRLATHPNIIS